MLQRDLALLIEYAATWVNSTQRSRLQSMSLGKIQAEPYYLDLLCVSGVLVLQRLTSKYAFSERSAGITR